MRAWLCQRSNGCDEVSPGELPLIVNMGFPGHPLTVTKEYGPTIGASLRISISVERGCWVIERQTGPHDEWKEWATVPLQLDEDFAEEDGVS